MKDDRLRGIEPRPGATIVAPATAAGAGAVAILRLSGPGAFAIAAGLTGLDPARTPPRVLSRCVVRDAGEREIDAGLAVFFPAPRSFTGEDVVELHLHGSPVVVERAAQAAVALGAVPAAPGEFTRRAYLNGKMDLTQAEGLADLIVARTAAAGEAALRQLRGGIGLALAPLRGRLLSLMTLLEAAIDFPEEADIASGHAAELKARMSEIRSALGRLVRSFGRGHRFRDGATVVIAGVANVGKSSLLNRLLGEERAIVAEAPGTTRDYLSGDISLGGIPVRLIDTAGLRQASDPVEREGVRRAREIVAGADILLFVLDRSRLAQEVDRSAYGDVAQRPHLLVLNKADLPLVEGGSSFRGPGLKEVLSVSARTGAGIGMLLEALGREVAPAAGDIMGEAPLTRLRHLEAARSADDALARAEGAADRGLPHEFIAADVREAARALAGLTGEIAPEEVLDAIFASFCIGK